MHRFSTRQPLRLLLWLCAFSLLNLTSGLQVPDHTRETTLRTITRHVPPPQATAVPPSEPQVYMARPTPSIPNPDPAPNPRIPPEGEKDLKPRQGTPTPQAARPTITEAPSLNDADATGQGGTALAHDEEGIITGIDPEGRTWRFRQTTYYSCLTRGATYTHCGWYRPIREAGAARFGGAGDGMMGVAARAGVAAGLVAVVLGG